MPPTSRAGYFHSLQVHLQVHTWKHFKTMLPVDEFGFKIDGGNIIPIVTDLPVAPDNILKDIRCNCHKKQNRRRSWTCVKNRLTCSIHCKCECDCNNGGPVEVYHNNDIISENENVSQ